MEESTSPINDCGLKQIKAEKWNKDGVRCMQREVNEFMRKEGKKLCDETVLVILVILIRPPESKAKRRLSGSVLLCRASLACRDGMLMLIPANGKFGAVEVLALVARNFQGRLSS